MITNIFDNIIQTRKIFTDLVDGMTLDQLNVIPEGFNNNIAWNYGHIVVSTPGLVYIRTGIEAELTIPLREAYGKGSKPTYYISQEEIDGFKAEVISTVKEIKQDYDAGIFFDITPYSTSTYKLELYTIEEVLIATLMHDNLHLGYAQAQRRKILGSAR